MTYVLRSKSGPSTNWNAIHGTIMHDFMEQVMRGKKKVTDYYSYVNVQEIPESIKHKLLMSYDSIASLHKKILNAIKKEIKPKRGQRIKLSTELKIELNNSFEKCEGADSIFAKAFLDLSAFNHDSVFILDYKSRLTPYKDYTEQLNFYIWMSKKRFPYLNRAYGYLADLGTGELRKVIDVDRNRIEDLTGKIMNKLEDQASKYASLEPSLFKPKKNRYCKFCQFQEQCPLNKS